MAKNLRIVFMGTPEFAVPSLQALVEGHFEVVGVVTAPDKPAGRGLKLTPSPVKSYALSQGLPVLQPEKLRDPDFLTKLHNLRADLQVIVAFRMLPEVVWNMPPMGSFNLHASLLPHYRGAAPINWAIINGETRTGLTTFFLQHEIDTGDLLLQEEEPIWPEDTAGTLYERLMYKGGKLVAKTARLIAEGNVSPQPQSVMVETKAAPKIFRETCQINFSLPAAQVHNFIRGLSPYPGAWTLLDGKTCKVFRSMPYPNYSGPSESQYVTDQKSFLEFRTAGGGAIRLLEVQMEGKKRMGIEEFLRGHKLEVAGY